LLVIAGASVYLSPLSVLAAVPLWLGAILTFLVITGYSWAECMALVQQYLPLCRGRVVKSFTTGVSPDGRDGAHAVRSSDFIDQQRASVEELDTFESVRRMNAS
jgi:hypothetical protein